VSDVYQDVKIEVHTMKAMEFKVWMKLLDRVSRGQRDKVRERLQEKTSVDRIVTLIEQSLNDEPACLYCMGTKLYRWGKVCELQRYRCRQCKRTFNALANTPLAR
jgi:transposase-like protein